MKFRTPVLLLLLSAILLTTLGVTERADAQLGTPTALKTTWVQLECFKQTGPNLSVYVVKNTTSATIPAGTTIHWKGSKSSPASAFSDSTEKLEAPIAPGATQWLTKNPIGASTQGPTCTAEFSAGLPDLKVNSVAFSGAGVTVQIANANPWVDVAVPFVLRSQATNNCGLPNGGSGGVFDTKELTGLTLGKGATKSLTLPLQKGAAVFAIATVDATNVVIEAAENNNRALSAEYGPFCIK